MERLCLACRKPLIGRADKKFCDDHCRSSFNNLLRIQDQCYLKQINQILRRNRAILKANYLGGKLISKKEWLSRKGFNFAYHTHTAANENGKSYFCCYEYGYTILGDEVFLVKGETD